MADDALPITLHIVAKNFRVNEDQSTNFDILHLKLPEGDVTPVFTSLGKAQHFCTALARYNVDFSEFRVYEVENVKTEGPVLVDPLAGDIIAKLAEASKQQ